MVLAAQYESLVLPLAVILIVPMTILSALLDEAATRQNDSFDETGINFS